MQPANPENSVLMPFFNQGSYLEAAIRSVLSHAYPNKELILIDGGSAGGWAEIIKRYQSARAYSVSESNRGQSNPLNEDLGHLTGDTIGYFREILGNCKRIGYLRKKSQSSAWSEN